MDKQEAIAKLTEQLEQIPQLKKKGHSSSEFTQWKRDTEVTIQHVFGENTRHIKDFNKIHYAPTVFSLSGVSDDEWNRSFWNGLDKASAILKSFVNEVEKFWRESAPYKSRDALSILEHFCLRFHQVAR